MHVYWAPEKFANVEVVEMAKSFGISVETVWGVREVPDKESMTLDSIARIRVRETFGLVPREWVMADASGLYVPKDCVRPKPPRSLWRYGSLVRVANLHNIPAGTEVYAHTVFVLVSPSGVERLFSGEAWGTVSLLPLLPNEHVFKPLIPGNKPSYFERAFKRVLEGGSPETLTDVLL